MKGSIKSILFLLSILIGSGVASAEKYRGTVGPYPVTAEINIDNDAVALMVRNVEASGRYTYTKAGNTLYLSGVATMYPGPDSDMYLGYPIYDLTETTKSGKESATWVLYSHENGLHGEMTTSKGETFKVELKEVK